MPIPASSPFLGRKQLLFVVAMFLLSVCIKAYLLRSGPRAFAVTPLTLFVVLFSLWRRSHQAY
jgi:hypothetical protein